LFKTAHMLLCRSVLVLSAGNETIVNNTCDSVVVVRLCFSGTTRVTRVSQRVRHPALSPVKTLSLTSYAKSVHEEVLSSDIFCMF